MRSKPALLNAEIVWKRACQAPRGPLAASRNHGRRSKKVTDSTTTTKITKRRRRRRTSRSVTSISSMPKNSRPRSPKRPPTTSTSSPAYIVTPSPPSWISPAMTASPDPLQWVALSKRVRPVTQIAETDVNSESQPLVHPRDSDEAGSASSNAPRPITTAKAATTIHGRGVIEKRLGGRTRMTSGWSRMRRKTRLPGRRGSVRETIRVVFPSMRMASEGQESAGSGEGAREVGHFLNARRLGDGWRTCSRSAMQRQRVDARGVPVADADEEPCAGVASGVGTMNAVVGLTIETVSKLSRGSGCVSARGFNVAERGGFTRRRAG